MRYLPFDPRWDRALTRAQQEELKLSRLLFPVEYQRGGMDVFLVECARHDGSWYIVEYHAGAADCHFVICSCKAGQQKLPCKHGAAVLARMGAYPPLRKHQRRELREEAVA